MYSEEKAITLHTSTTEDKLPVEKKYVRAQNNYGGFKIEKIDDNQSKVTYYFEVKCELI